MDHAQKRLYSLLIILIVLQLFTIGLLVTRTGGVPEVMLHLRQLDLLDLDALTATGETLGKMLDWWEQSRRRSRSPYHAAQRYDRS